tara:strand:- start:300 stop:539 length:240 start_codon:yes stop_codon:yes gene_type:complete
MSKLSDKEREELNYLNIKNEIRDFTKKVDYAYIIRYMIEEFDTIDDINNTQSMELFKLISNLELGLQSYERLKNDLQAV